MELDVAVFVAERGLVAFEDRQVAIHDRLAYLADMRVGNRLEQDFVSDTVNVSADSQMQTLYDQTTEIINNLENQKL